MQYIAVIKTLLLLIVTHYVAITHMTFFFNYACKYLTFLAIIYSVKIEKPSIFLSVFMYIFVWVGVFWGKNCLCSSIFLLLLLFSLMFELIVSN